jgi:hypothetical protein
VRTTTNERYDQPERARPRWSRFSRPAKPILANLTNYAFAILAGLVLVCAIMLPASNLLSISFIFEHNYNEGWNVYNVQRIIDHELVYDDNYWRVNNYPVGSFFIVAGH